MKKVININFQGRVIPIEETAFELLKQYIESLRRYFANEEGRDEIINDIEGRIAELFSERLKKGAVCITDEDVNAVIASMGRPEDFDDAAGTTTETSSANANQQQQQQSYYQSQPAGSSAATGRGRLFRNADDKIIGGVASGLANYFKIDPVVMRIVFVVLFAPLFWVYVLLWVIIPSQSVETNITKRLYRSSEDKVISGVSGGLAAYFNVGAWVPRLIFALPLIIGLVSGPFNFWWDNGWDFWWGPKVITSSLGSTLFLTYIILWIAVPVAVTSAEKLEMRGEKVDLNSIRDTVKEDLEGFKHKAEKWGKEIKESAQQWGEKAKDFGHAAGSRAKTFTSEAGPVARSAGSGIGHVIGVLFKAFFLFIAGIVAVALFTALAAVLFSGFTVFPIKVFLLDGFWQNFLAWATLILFLAVPIIALLTWLIRRIMGVRSKNHYLGYVFGTLWVIGLVCAVTLSGTVYHDFKAGASPGKEPVTITQPSTGILHVNVLNNYRRYYGGDWFGFNRNKGFYAVNQDTVMLNNVRVIVTKSNDAEFHIYQTRLSLGSNPDVAKRLAERINFPIQQQDTILSLPKGFAISRYEKFRNQHVLVSIAVPVGKRVQMDRRIDDYNWFNIDRDNYYGWDGEDDYWERSYGWQSDKEYIMTPDNGLQRVDKYDARELKSGNFKLKIKDGDSEMQIEGEIKTKEKDKEKTTDTTGRYRYHREKKATDSVDSTLKKVTVSNREAAGEEATKGRGAKMIAAELNGPVSRLTRL